MKFINDEGAPDLPEELLTAQQSGNLVLFCGSGISVPAGLPDFKTLVENLWNNLSSQHETDQEKKYRMKKEYDRQLHLLERRVDRKLMMENIMKQLKLSKDADLSTHKAVLNLAKVNNHTGQERLCYRLITTNVDHGFLTNETKNLIDAAPCLPIPNPHKWSSIVYLHGIIDETKDPDGNNLVFTSGDFGKAYLTEAWASRFITKLFHHFHVLFVGYSANDPVLHYMIDAIATEIEQGNNDYKYPWVLAGYDNDNSPKEEINNEWLAKGVTPIFYNNENRHSNLHKTLHKWSNHVRDGLNSNKRIIALEAKDEPSPNSIKRVITVLKEKIGHASKSGMYAKQFGDIRAPIGWLEKLDEANMFTGSFITATTEEPNVITQNLWQWLLHYMKSPQLVTWIIKKKSNLHPDFKNKIRHKLEIRHKLDEQPQLKGNYLRFWQIMLSDQLWCSPKTATDLTYRIVVRFNPKNVITLHDFNTLIQPYFKLESHYDYLSKHKQELNENQLFNATVTIRLQRYAYEELCKKSTYPNQYSQILLSATHALLQAMKMWEFIDDTITNRENDISRGHMQSIAPHEQNHPIIHPWTNLIAINRDLWMSAYENERNYAETILKLWGSCQYPIFHRLVLYAYAESNIANTDAALTYLLKNNARWLWNNTVAREKFRLLDKICTKLNEQQKVSLINAVLKGPIIKKSPAVTSEQKKDDQVCHILAKLQKFGMQLNDIASKKLSELQNKDSFRLSTGEEDEFICYMTTSDKPPDICADQLAERKPHEILQLLTEKNDYTKGRLAAFRKMCEKFPKKAKEILSLTNRTQCYHKIWHEALRGLADSSDPLWNNITELLQSADDELYYSEASVIAHYLAKAIKYAVKKIDYFWLISNRLFEAQQGSKVNKEKLDNVINEAINHPIGMITEKFICLLKSHYKLKPGDEIKDRQCQAFLKKLITGNSYGFMLGRAILAYHLVYLLYIAPQWVKENLSPLFDWKNNENKNTKYYWQAYLSAGKFSIETVQLLKSHFDDTLQNHHNQLPEETVERLCQQFTSICLEFDEIYTAEEKSKYLRTIANFNGLQHVARFIFIYLSISDKPDSYWENRIAPFINQWPKDKEFKSPAVSENFAWSLLQLDTSFESAFSVLEKWALCSIDCPDIKDDFLNRLKETNLNKKYPSAVQRLKQKLGCE